METHYTPAFNLFLFSVRPGDVSMSAHWNLLHFLVFFVSNQLPVQIQRLGCFKSSASLLTILLGFLCPV